MRAQLPFPARMSPSAGAEPSSKEMTSTGGRMTSPVLQAQQIEVNWRNFEGNVDLSLTSSPKKMPTTECDVFRTLQQEAGFCIFNRNQRLSKEICVKQAVAKSVPDSRKARIMDHQIITAVFITAIITVGKTTVILQQFLSRTCTYIIDLIKYKS